ncbi:glycosyl transferase [Shinella sp. CPCC 101442]|uniref:glycosyl transferase n=1 Tax=Shinella sp. CPCC 101442 TaxID=2932265 RepID=UPI0021523308|nr:glycosyl transferase [Shinella sp. CPCC 101442]MCR6499225.1 glycosyl transferase [Shinella sp. CPCC 101442]
MLTIIMECRDNEAELAQTLSALVAGAVEGVVRDVIVLDHGSRDGSPRVADAAGCRFLTSWDMTDVVRSARGDWLLLLEPGARPLAGWVDAVVDHVAINGNPARFLGSRSHRRPFLQRLGRRKAPLELGYLVSKRQASAVVRSGMALADMAKGAGVRALVAEIVPAWAVKALRAEMAR